MEVQTSSDLTGEHLRVCVRALGLVDAHVTRKYNYQSTKVPKTLTDQPVWARRCSIMMPRRQFSGNKLRVKQKDRDLPCRLFIGNGCFNLTSGRKTNHHHERFWKEERSGTWSGLRDALLRGPKTFVLCNRKPSYSVLWSVLGVARS